MCVYSLGPCGVSFKLEVVPKQKRLSERSETKNPSINKPQWSKEPKNLSDSINLLEVNISHTEALLKMIFVSPGGIC